ncbi:MAG: metal-dependent hydrolase [Mycolicibacterium sp.]|jgi:predicted metal-dependent hydrolase|uniref:metal-dependent hydrolase n=1 Tax=Mycolicibacterium sp. TaxID=2320850 RepID=UPI000FB3358A|nr:metal-dependent hydrolase [Mycolicibacterium sp.]RUP30680.1 MAG: metal-dependent hydrolase [Mycolicibacterium sp.]TXH15241.1 MAG: metal-dependent hydrolase [Mycobacterium sp.]
MLRPQRFANEVDPGPVQIQARNVAFETAGKPKDWIPGHPVSSHLVNLLNVMLPAGERWFVEVFNEALPLIKDPKLAEDVRGFIGQEAMHAEAHDTVMHEYMIASGVDVAPLLDQIEFVFKKTLAPSKTTNPRRKMNHLIERLWLIAAIEHFTAVLGDFVLNCNWDDYDADPTLVDLYRWHGAEEVEHRSVAHDVATYFRDSYLTRVRAMAVAGTGLYVLFQRGMRFLVKSDPQLQLSWWRIQRMRMQDSKLGLLPEYWNLLFVQTLAYFKPSYSPEHMGSTAQAVAYLANSPAARAAHH